MTRVRSLIAIVFLVILSNIGYTYYSTGAEVAPLSPTPNSFFSPNNTTTGATDTPPIPTSHPTNPDNETPVLEFDVPGPVRNWQGYLIDCIYDPHVGSLFVVLSHPIASAQNYTSEWKGMYDTLRSAHFHSTLDQYHQTWANVKEDGQSVVDTLLIRASLNREQMLVPCEAQVVGPNHRYYLFATTLVCESPALKVDEHDAVLDDDILFQLVHMKSSWISPKFVRVHASSRSAGLFKHVARRKAKCEREQENNCFPYQPRPSCEDCEDDGECCARSCAIFPDLVPSRNNFQHSKQTADDGECAAYCNSMKYWCVFWVREVETGLCQLSIDEEPHRNITRLVQADFSVTSVGSTSGVNCQRGWCRERPDTFLQGFPPSFDGPNAFFALADAKAVCNELSDCGGVTRDTYGVYSLRRGVAGPEASPVGDTSYVKDEDCYGVRGNSVAGIMSVAYTGNYFMEEVAEVFRLQGFAHLYVLVGTHVAETYPSTHDLAWTNKAEYDAHNQKVVAEYRKRLSHLSSDFVSVVDVSGPFNRGEVRGLDHLRQFTNNLAATHAWSFGATYVFRGDSDNTFMYDRNRYSSAVHALDTNFNSTCQARLLPRDAMVLACEHAGSGWLGERYPIEACYANYAVHVYKRTCRQFSLHMCQLCCQNGSRECLWGQASGLPPQHTEFPLSEGALQHWVSANVPRAFKVKCDTRPSLYTTQWLPLVQESLGKLGIKPVAPNTPKEYDFWCREPKGQLGVAENVSNVSVAV